MKLLIIPKPVLNKDLAVNSYCFRFQRADEYLNTQLTRFYDGIINSPCIDVLEMVGLDSFTNGQPIFVPVNNLTLLTDLDKQFLQPADKIIFLIDDKISPEEHYMTSIIKLKESGHGIAIENVSLSNYDAMKPFIDLCDYIFIDCTAPDYREFLNKLSRGYKHYHYVATNVADMDTFYRLLNQEFELFEGKFYSVPVTHGNKTISPVKANYIQLLNIIRNEDFEIGDVVKIVRQDTSLTISLLRFVNSPYLGLSQKINTIQHAAAMIGQSELRKWVITALSATLASDKPDEISKLSLMRAKFMENLAGCFHMGEHSENIFMMGLFSILDVALDVSMSEALKEVTVTDAVYNALIYMEGDFAIILDFVYKYESAEWDEVYKAMIINNVNVEDVFNAYINAVGWYGSIISMQVSEIENET